MNYIYNFNNKTTKNYLVQNPTTISWIIQSCYVHFTQSLWSKKIKRKYIINMIYNLKELTTSYLYN